jgi:thiamine pyrophosphate-dependent acetolactate synthase large subunit-like protein
MFNPFGVDLNATLDDESKLYPQTKSVSKTYSPDIVGNTQVPMSSGIDLKLDEIGNKNQSKEGMNSQVALQAGAAMLDTLGNAITNYQMSKAPVPVMTMTRAPRFNTYIDTTPEINRIDSNSKRFSKFITDNIRGSSNRRAAMNNLMIQTEDSKSNVWAKKTAMETDLENKNVEMAYQNTRENNQNAYNNSMNRYSANQASLSRYSQITSNFSDKIADIGARQAQLDSNDIAFETLLLGMPANVRNKLRASTRRRSLGFSSVN